MSDADYSRYRVRIPIQLRERADIVCDYLGTDLATLIRGLIEEFLRVNVDLEVNAVFKHTVTSQKKVLKEEKKETCSRGVTIEDMLKKIVDWIEKN
jgi:predicted DNA-binding protein